MKILNRGHPSINSESITEVYEHAFFLIGQPL